MVKRKVPEEIKHVFVVSRRKFTSKEDAESFLYVQRLHHLLLQDGVELLTIKVVEMLVQKYPGPMQKLYDGLVRDVEAA